jgi:CubicO group peptidase (beta-lactamase class C family)
MKKVLFLLLLPFVVFAQKDYTAQIDNYMQAAVKINQFSGSVLIKKRGNIIYEKTFGTLDYAAKHPLDNNSMFELGLITEEFTATAILLLRDEGKLKLSDPITAYFPELPYSNLTLEHLLTHTSGLPDYYEGVMKNKWGTKTFASNNDIIKQMALAKIPLACQPGSKYDDSWRFTDYILLAAVIEKVSGLGYVQFLQRKMFGPLNMRHTAAYIDLQKENRALVHTESVYFDETKQQLFPSDSFQYLGAEYTHIAKNIVGSKGISSTAHDLCLWDNAVTSHTLLSAATQQEMFSHYVLKDTPNQISFGYGVLTGKNEFGNYVQQRDDGNNETLGYVTTMIRYTRDDVTIILLANKARNSSSIAGILSYILFDRDIVPPSIHKQVTIDTSLLGKYSGQYALPSMIGLYAKDGALWATITGEPDLKLLPESPTKFFSSNKEYDWQIEFETGANGRVLKTYFIFSGLRKEAIKQ